MAATPPGIRWAVTLLAWVGIVLSLQAQSAPPTDQEPPAEEQVELPVPFPGTPPAPPPAFKPGQPPAPDRWFIMRELQGTWLGALLDDERLTFTGWTEASFTASTSRVSNLPVTFNDRANRFLLQQQWFRLDRPVVTSGTEEPSYGYHLDVLVGSDYRWTLMRDLFNSQLVNSTGAQNLYGVDPLQFYVNAYFPKLFQGTEIRVGRTYNPWGYESLEAISTPLLSRSYAFFNTPFTVMALAAYTRFSPEWALVLMLTNGNDTFFGPAEEARTFGKLTYTAPNQRDVVQLGWTLGRGKFNAGDPFAPATIGLAQEPVGHNNFNAFDLVYTHTFSPNFIYANETMYAWQSNVPATNNPIISTGSIVRSGTLFPGTAHWASMAHYFRSVLTPNIGDILRVETFADFNGQRTGFPGLYLAVTEGLQFKLAKGITLRPELRYDYNFQSRPFEGKHGQFLAASDLIIRW